MVSISLDELRRKIQAEFPTMGAHEAHIRACRIIRKANDTALDAPQDIRCLVLSVAAEQAQ